MIPGIYKGAPLKIAADDWRIAQQMIAEYRARGAMGSGGGFRFAQASTPPHPFQPTQTGPLKVKVASGMWWGQTYENESFDTEIVRPLWMNEHRLNEQEFTVADNTTTIILVKVTYAYFQSGDAYQWKISSITFTTDTSATPDLPGNDIPLDNFVDNIETPPALTPPYEKYTPIVYVEAASGEITTIIPLVNRDVHDPIAGSVFNENP